MKLVEVDEIPAGVFSFGLNSQDKIWSVGYFVLTEPDQWDLIGSGSAKIAFSVSITLSIILWHCIAPLLFLTINL